MSRFVIERADGEQRVLGGYKLGAPPPDARQYATRSDALPAKIDLRKWMSTVEDQGQTNSCAANATAGAYEYLMKRHLGESGYDVSRMFIYYNARAASGAAIEDEGAVLTDVIETLRANGACSEQTWPFEPTNVNEAPDDGAFSEASQFKVDDVQQVPTELAAWKSALADGHPIIFGLKLFGSFDKQRKPGLVPLPSRTEGGRESHGGHAMLCVGYSDPDQVFIVRNSWGEGWGDEGYCYIPYDYVMNPDFNYGDSWVIHRVDLLGPPDDATSDDQTSLLEDVGTFLGQLDDDAYGNLLESMGDTHLERRLALLFLRVVAADGNASEEELASAAEFLAPALETIGARVDAARLLERTAKVANDDALLEETVAIFADHVPAEVLASLANQLQEAAGADGEIAREEADVLNAILSVWQLGEGATEEENAVT